MNRINYGSVLLGGLVAGVVLNIGEFLLNGVLLAKQMEDAFRRYNVQPPGTRFMVIAVVMTFLLGIALVLTYALIRPRMGPGPKTAIVASLIFWFAIPVYTGILSGVLFEVPINVILIGIVWALVEYALAAIAGAWLYKES
jgi:hypothetical protein